jgi:excisionase family DNA binding protein
MLTDVRTAAENLGCSQSHIRRMIKQRAWPVYRLGPGAIRVDPEEIRALTRVRGNYPSVELTNHDRQR